GLSNIHFGDSPLCGMSLLYNQYASLASRWPAHEDMLTLKGVRKYKGPGRLQGLRPGLFFVVGQLSRSQLSGASSLAVDRLSGIGVRRAHVLRPRGRRGPERLRGWRCPRGWRLVAVRCEWCLGVRRCGRTLPTWSAGRGIGLGRCGLLQDQAWRSSFGDCCSQSLTGGVLSQIGAGALAGPLEADDGRRPPGG